MNDMDKSIAQLLLMQKLLTQAFEWKKSVDLLCITNGCKVDALIGDKDGDLGSMYSTVCELEKIHNV